MSSIRRKIDPEFYVAMVEILEAKSKLITLSESLVNTLSDVDVISINARHEYCLTCGQIMDDYYTESRKPRTEYYTRNLVRVKDDREKAFTRAYNEREIAIKVHDMKIDVIRGKINLTEVELTALENQLLTKYNITSTKSVSH